MNIIRIKRLEKNIKYKIFLIIYKKINDLRILNDINILDVIVNKNLSTINIYVTFINKINIYKKISILNNSSNLLKNILFKKISLKFFPKKILFIYDYNLEKSINLIKIINSIKYG